MIQGKEREQKDQQSRQKRVGLFEAEVVAINPTTEEYAAKLGIELPGDSKATEYLGTSKDGNSFLRVDVWLNDVKTDEKYKVTFFLEDKERENKDGTKKQYINNIGTCTWAVDRNSLPDWFTSREYRVAKAGEEDLYTFLRSWLGKLDYKDAESVLELDWRKLMKGNTSELRSQVYGAYCTNFVALATIISKEKDGEMKEYQGVYNGGFLPVYTLKNFRLINYSDEKVLSGLRAKKTKDLKPYERFVLNIKGEYGCKDYFILHDIKDYNPEENLVASDTPLEEDSSDY